MSGVCFPRHLLLGAFALLSLLQGCSSLMDGGGVPDLGYSSSTVRSSASETATSSWTELSSSAAEGAPYGGRCSLTLPNATGDEPDGLIPVCCTTLPAEDILVQEAFALLNAYRESNGVAALTWDPQLAAAIQGHCIHMAVHSFFDHDAPEAEITRFTTRANQCGASANGENIARGSRTAQAVMDMWKSSEGHNRNMLNATYRRGAIGYHDRFWGQIFGR